MPKRAIDQLEGAYALETPADNIDYYRDFAESYDEGYARDMGYVYPREVARLFLAEAEPNDSPVLDAEGAPVSDIGSCDAVDRDGDTWSLWYRNNASGRVWKVIGGTGKYAKMAGGGSTELLVATDDGRATIRWQGSWKR